LATNINGCNEIIENNETGILVEKKNAKSLELGIEKLLLDEELYLHIKNKVRNEMIKKYNQNYFWEELKNEFKIII